MSFLAGFKSKRAPLSKPGKRPPHVHGPVWLLGTCYHTHVGAEEKRDEEWGHFQLDFYSRLWFTYRRDFAPLGAAQLTSDVGWGCMLRSGQMLLGQALLTHFLGREWRFRPSQGVDKRYGDVLRWFADAPERCFPYSLHNIATYGERFGKSVGEWMGPNTITQVIGALLADQCPSTLTFAIADDAVLYRAELLAQCAAEARPASSPLAGVDPVLPAYAPEYPHGEGTPSAWKALLVMVPLRLGVDEVNPIYHAVLLAFLEMAQCVGIVGGRPRSSFFFVGHHGPMLVYLDPHQPQPSIWMHKEFVTNSFHCNHVRSMPVDELDPSLAVGFYCRTREDFDDLCAQLTLLCAKHPPTISVADERPSYMRGDGAQGAGAGADAEQSDEDGWDLL